MIGIGHSSPRSLSQHKHLAVTRPRENSGLINVEEEPGLANSSMGNLPEEIWDSIAMGEIPVTRLKQDLERVCGYQQNPGWIELGEVC